MIKKKKAATLGLVLAITASLLAACGSSGNDGSKGSASPGNSASTDAPPITLKFITWNYADRQPSFDAWFKDMKDKYNITIDTQNVPSDSYATTLKTKYASNDLPDLFTTRNIDNNLNLGEKMTVEADQLVDLSNLPSVQNFLPAVIEDRKRNKAGKLYYVPVSSNVLGVFYNKQVFTDNGIAIPTNIDEFIAACEKLKALGIAPMAAGFKDAWTTQIIPFIAFGQYVNTKDPTAKEKLSTGEMKYVDIKDNVMKALNVQQDWLEKGYFNDNYLGTDANTAGQLLATGKAAMMVMGSWQLSTIKSMNPEAEIGFFALPLNAAGEQTILSSSADEGVVINADSKNMDAAMRVMDYYLSPENQARIMKDLNGIPTNTKVQVEDPFTSEIQDVMTKTAVQPDWWGTGGLYYPQNITFDMGKELQNLVAKGTTVNQLIEDLDTAVAKALGK